MAITHIDADVDVDADVALMLMLLLLFMLMLMSLLMLMMMLLLHMCIADLHTDHARFESLLEQHQQTHADTVTRWQEKALVWGKERREYKVRDTCASHACCLTRGTLACHEMTYHMMCIIPMYPD